MRKLSLVIISLLIVAGAMAQNSNKKAEILYFKASLSCCQAKACNNLENITKEIIAKNFSSNEIAFKTILLADETNKSLVEKYNAKSQTVVIVNNKKKTSLDISKTVAKFAQDNNQEEFEKAIVSQIKVFLK